MSADDSRPDRRWLRHDIPHWVDDDAWFFITINCRDRDFEQLTLPQVSGSILEAAKFYHNSKRWHIGLMLLMPDHLHALMGFSRGGQPMAKLFHDWKRYTARSLNVRWQEGYFDHRLRNVAEADAKFHYIRQNPVVKGLCKAPEEWPHQIRFVDGVLIMGAER